jgi:hypothetical protein
LLLTQIFFDNLLPIFLTAGAGFALGQWWRPDLKTVSRLVLYVFNPCLIFVSLTSAKISSAEVGQMALFTLLVVVVNTLVGAMVGKALRFNRTHLAAFVIALAFVNGGNYGLPLVQFAFGDGALSHAVVYLVFSTVAVYTLGVTIASLGRSSWQQTARAALTLPANYALVAAGIMRFNQWGLPLPIDRAVNLLSQAALPAMLVLLGLQVSASVNDKDWRRVARWPLSVGVALRLIVGPLIGWGVARALGLTGPQLQAAIIEAAMPTAVITTILAVEYDLDAALINSIVIVSTILSPLTLTPLIAWLR